MNINFINTGLDELIYKSVLPGRKVMKLIHIPASDKHKAYNRMQEVNAEESKQLKTNKKNAKSQPKPKYKKKVKDEYHVEPMFTLFPSVQEYQDYLTAHSYIKPDGQIGYYSPDPSSEVKKYVDDNIIRHLVGKTFKCMGNREVKVKDVRFHFYDRINQRFQEIIEEVCQHVVANDIRMRTGWNVYAKPNHTIGPVSSKATYTAEKFDEMIDVPPPREIMDEYNKRVEALVVGNTKSLSDKMSKMIVDAVNNPKFIKNGKNSDNRFSNDPEKQGSTEFITDDVTVVIAHTGYLMSFWPNNLGKKFAYKNGWDGEHPPDPKDFNRSIQHNNPELKVNWDRILNSNTKVPKYFEPTEFVQVVKSYYAKMEG